MAAKQDVQNRAALYGKCWLGKHERKTRENTWNVCVEIILFLVTLIRIGFFIRSLPYGS